MSASHETAHAVAVTTLGKHYQRYRLTDPSAEEAMAGSLRRYGQMAPVAACWRGQQLEVIDGFKRLHAASEVGLATLNVCVLDLDERRAKAAILGLNHGHRPTRELEEAWIVQALVREDGLSQVEAGMLLGRHKSWVCRRLALLEKLSPDVIDDMRLGLLGPTLARQLTRLPAGNQQAVLALTRRQGLTAPELAGVVQLLQSASEEQAAFVLAQPRKALACAQATPTALRDPRLSARGHWVAKQLAPLLDVLSRMETWLTTPAQRELTPLDREVLQPSLARLGQQSSAVAELIMGIAFLDPPSTGVMS